MAIAAKILVNSGKKVLLIDGVAEGITVDILMERVQRFEPDIIFIETSTPSVIWDLEIIKKLKMIAPAAKIIASGCIAPVLAEELLLKTRAIDYWVMGEYDVALNELIDALGYYRNHIEVDGVMELGKKAKTYAKVKDLNSLPMPLYEQLPIANYSDPVCGLPSPSAVSWLSRGCPFGCTFCVWPQVVYFDRKYRVRDIGKALDEVCYLIEHYGCQSYYFDDDTTNIGEARMLQLASKIRERKLNIIPWSMMARADCMTKKAIFELADAGLYSIKYGVESAVPELLERCGKNINMRKLEEAIQYTKECGIKIHLTFTLGLPGETKETIKQTLDFAMKIAPETAQFSLCTPFPGTSFYEECLKNNWLITKDWNRFLGSEEAVISTPSLSADELNIAFGEVCKVWGDFVNSRQQARRDALKKKLKTLVESGEKWTLLGEKESADFLFNDELLKKAFVDGEVEDKVVVIISKSNEEKIWRNLCKSNKKCDKPVLKLYDG